MHAPSVVFDEAPRPVDQRRRLPRIVSGQAARFLRMRVEAVSSARPTPRISAFPFMTSSIQLRGTMAWPLQAGSATPEISVQMAMRRSCSAGSALEVIEILPCHLRLWLIAGGKPSLGEVRLVHVVRRA
jgi:hypothetical protein